MLYLCTWHGDPDAWITLTPQDPKHADSATFDEGLCTGFVISEQKSQQFTHELLTLLAKYGIDVSVHY